MYGSKDRRIMAAQGVHEAVLGSIWENFDKLQNLKILDAPCGGGPMSEFLASKGAKVTGIDLNPPAVSDNGVEYIQNNLETIEPNYDYYDIVICVEGVEHLHNPHAWITKISNMLKPNGIAIISTPNPDSLSSRWKVFTRGYPQYFDLVPNRLDIFKIGRAHV